MGVFGCPVVVVAATLMISKQASADKNSLTVFEVLIGFLNGPGHLGCSEFHADKMSASKEKPE